MEILQTLADLSIRRACGFAALAIAVVMLALSFDLVLAFRSGAVLTSLLCGIVWAMALWSPRRDMRSTEMWMLLRQERLFLTRGAQAPRTMALARQVLRDRLTWHGERIAVAAMALWLLTGVAMLARWMFGG